MSRLTTTRGALRAWHGGSPWTSLGTLALGLAVACAVMGLTGGQAALPTAIEILAPVGLAALAVAQLAGAGRLRLGSLRRRFELGVALALGQLLAAVGIGAAVMFVSSHDAWMTVAIVLFAGIVATRAAQLLLDGVVRDVDAVRTGLHAVEAGERGARIEAGSSRELQDLAASANRMAMTLAAEERSRDAAEAARRQLIAAVSHDLRTPLSTIQLLTEALQDGLGDAETARRYLQTLGANVSRLGGLIDNLFEMACLDAGEIGWSAESVCLPALIRESCALVQPAVERAGVRLRADLPPGLAPARGNAQKLQRVLLNLLQNAIHHTPPNGSIAVHASAVDDGLQVEVSDTGSGIVPEDRAHVFEPFYRGSEEAARTTPGSGLGLAISRAIVEAHGGRIWLLDAPRGTRVRFTLPAEVEGDGTRRQDGAPPLT
jgi:signal transduction histidine kinase